MACKTCHGLDVPPFEAPEFGLRVDPTRLELSVPNCDGCAFLHGALNALDLIPMQIAYIDLYNALKGAPLGVSIQLRDMRPTDQQYGVARRKICLELFVSDDKPSRWPCIGAGRPLLGQPSLQDAVSLASLWYADCKAHHKSCHSTPRTTPTRLVHVGVPGRYPHLVEPGMDFEEPYLPLSHCWGSRTIHPDHNC